MAKQLNTQFKKAQKGQKAFNKMMDAGVKVLTSKPKGSGHSRKKQTTNYSQSYSTANDNNFDLSTTNGCLAVVSGIGGFGILIIGHVFSYRVLSIVGIVLLVLCFVLCVAQIVKGHN